MFRKILVANDGSPGASAALDVAIEDVTLRERVRQELAKLADWVRNDPDNEHDKHH